MNTLTEFLSNTLIHTIASLLLDYGIIELIALVGVVILCRDKAFAHSVFQRCEGLIVTLSQRSLAKYVGLFALTILLRLLLLPALPIPDPYVPDEFSHLLVADTLAHGRLANPPHELAKHLESIQILQKPSYASMYLPGQGLFLALGQVVFGHPWFGVLLSAGLASCAMLWMLEAYFEKQWALVGAVVFVIRYCVTSYWMNSYWGGFVGAIGGALVMGAVGRWRHGWSYGTAIAGALGCLLVALTRPYEGALLIATAAIWIAWRTYRRDAPAWRAFAGPVMAGLVVSVCGLVWLGVYCEAVTGSPVKLPYSLNREQYGWPLTLAWFRPVDVQGLNKEMSDYLQWEKQEHQTVESFSGFILSLPGKSRIISVYFIGFSLFVAFVFGLWGWRDRRLRPVFLVSGAVGVGLIFEQSWYPHYIAPVSCAAVAICLHGLRRLRGFQWKGQQIGIPLTRGLLLPTLLAQLIYVSSAIPPFTKLQQYNYFSWLSTTGRGAPRAGIAKQIEALPGNHVIFVRYDRDMYNTFEWVYNSACVDCQKVVWLRDLGKENDRAMKYYPGRRFWLAEPDAKPMRLSPYDPGSGTE